jgi:hypothetical protein
LHSYGFTEGVLRNLGIFIVVQLAVGRPGHHVLAAEERLEVRWEVQWRIPARSFDTEGVTTLRPLSAPA